MRRSRFTFTQRLQTCIANGDLIIADLQKWFDRPYPTVRTWALEDRTPRGSLRQRRHALLRLEMLELAVAKKRFPVAIDMNERQRGRYVEGIRREFETAGLP